jgi:hypothetical protein
MFHTDVAASPFYVIYIFSSLFFFLYVNNNEPGFNFGIAIVYAELHL